MIKILQVNKLFYPWIGGVETVVRQLAEGLAKRPDFDVSVLAGNEHKSLKNKHYKWKNINVIKAASIGFKFSTPLSASYPFLLKRLINENDVFHFHAPNPLGELAAYLSPIPKHKKVIVTVHADVQQTRWKFFSPVYNFFFKKLLERADVITTMGSQNIDCFKSITPFRSKCVVVPLAYDETHDYPVSAEDIEAFMLTYALHKGKKTIIFVGRLSYYKGLSFLLEAVKQIEDVQLLIVGDGQLKQDIEDRINKLNLKDRVVMTGFLQGLLLATAYTLSDIFVLPSTTESETFGIVQAEAMKFGLPVINTSLPTAVPSVSLHGQTGLTVPPANVPALKNALNQILNDDALREKYAQNSLERSHLFSPEIMVENFRKIYTQP